MSGAIGVRPRGWCGPLSPEDVQAAVFIALEQARIESLLQRMRDAVALSDALAADLNLSHTVRR